MGSVLRLRFDVPARVALGVPVTVCLLLTACGSPPEPPRSAPPLSETPSASGPAALPPPVVVPLTTPPVALPTGVPTTIGVPGYPAYPTPTLPRTTTPPTTVATMPTTTRPTPAVSPAPRCTAGPTAAQLVAAVENTTGIPDEPLTVTGGPFCAGTWQFSTMEIGTAATRDRYERLSVVTKGAPTALQLAEAGTDVCSKLIRDEAPPGIRVHACGA